MTKNIFIFLLQTQAGSILSSPSKATRRRTKPKIETTKMNIIETTQTTTYTNDARDLRLIVHHNGPWAEYGEVQSIKDWELNRYPTRINITDVNNLLAYWGREARQN